MQDKIKSFEDLVNEVNLAKSELEKLCSDTITNIDKQKVKEIQGNLETYRKALNRFESEISPEEKEKMAEEIDDIESSLAGIDAGIEITEQVPAKSVEDATEDGKTGKNRIKRARERLKGKGNKIIKNENGERKKALIGLGGVGGARFVGRQVWKSRIDGYSDMTRKQKRNARKKWKRENRETGNFWKRPLGKTLKWVGITLGVGTLRQYLSKSDKLTSKAENQSSDTVELKANDPEKYKKYKGIGENVDNQYNTIMEKEIKSGWGGMSIADGYENYADKENVDKEVFKATVPMCIDNQYSSVSKFLSEGGYYSYLRGLKFEKLKDVLKTRTRDHIGKFIGPFLINLTSYIPYKGKDWKKGLEEWLESGSSDKREQELQLFFRQYVKVLNYTQEKCFCLEELIAEKKFRNITDVYYPTVQDALKDEKFLEDYVYPDPDYKKFMGGKLHQAVDVMKNNGIFDGEVSGDMQKIIHNCDKARDKILKYKGGKDALQRLEENADNLTRDNYIETADCCNDIIKDIEDEFEKSFMYLFFSGYQVARNDIEISEQEFLTQSGFYNLKGGILDAMNDYKQKFVSGEATSQDILRYKDLVNSRFSMKKEIDIGAKAIKKMKGNNPSVGERALNVGSAIFKDVYEHTKASIRHFKDGHRLEGWVAATAPLYLGGTGIKLLGKASGIEFIENTGKRISKANAFYTAWHIKGPAMRRGQRDRLNLNKWPNWLVKSRYDVPNGDQLLLQDLLEGRISGDTASRVISDGNETWKHVKKGNSISEFVQTMLGQDTSLPIKDLRILFENSENINFMSNPTIRKLFFGDPSISPWDSTVGKVRNGFNKKIYKPSTSFGEDIKVLEGFLVGHDGTSSVFKTLSAEQQSFVKQLLESGDFKKIENVKLLLENIKSYDLTGLSDAEISRLVWHVAINTDKLGDVGKINKAAQDIHANPSAVIDRGDTIPDELSPKAKAIDDDLLYVRNNIIEQFDDIDNLPRPARSKVQEIDNFRKTLSTMDEADVEKLSKLLGEFKKTSGGMGDAIEQLTLLKKIKEASVGKALDLGMVDIYGNPITKNFDDIVKNMNGEDLKLLCKQLGISDDVEPLARTFKAINESNVHKLVGTSDELLEVMGKLMKYFTKLT